MVTVRPLASIAMFFFSGIAGAHATPATCSERLLSSSSRAATGEIPLTARDLIELRDFGQVTAPAGREPFALSPDGRFAALTLRRADTVADSYCVGIVLVPLVGRSRPRLLDVGGQAIPSRNDVHGIAAIPSGLIHSAPPAWSPDGRAIAFLRRDAGVTQVWVVAVDGGPAKRLTRMETEPLRIAWSDDGRSLLVTTREGVDRARAAIDEEGKRGYLYDERFWTIADAQPHPSATIPTEVNLVDVSTGSVRAIGAAEAARLRKSPADRPGAVRSARSASGAVAWVGNARDDRPRGPTLLHVEIGHSRMTCALEACGQGIAGLWWGDAGALFFLRAATPENGGRTALYRWQTGSRTAPVRLFETEDLLLGCEKAGPALYCAQETLVRPRVIVRIDLRTGARTTVFDPNPEFASFRLGRAERMRWSDRDGVSTYGDLVLPPDHKIGQRHPLVVVQYFSRGFLRGGIGDEYPIQLFAQQGYAVLSFQMPSEDEAAAAAPDAMAAQAIKVRNWAGRRRIFQALDAGIDAAVARGVIEPDAIAITGMSDGASTVQFALNNSSRFKAAIMSSCCEDPSAIYIVGPSYGATVAQWNYPAAGEDGRAFWRPQSLALNAGRLDVPILMQLADNEFRMAAEGYSALRSHGVPVEMFVYPDEWHTKMHPAHRLTIYARNLAWLDFWLRDRVSPAPEAAREIERWTKLRQVHRAGN
ncbi:Atxe2 family lasso peptide isopeptidase [Sphingomonas sp. CJ20]